MRPTNSPPAKRGAKPNAPLDRGWHLARTPLEMDVAEIEYALMRCYEAFGRWQAECLASVIEFSASGPENALLHIIGMNERPKTIRDLAHMTNREDIPNIQYSLRKLLKAKLISRKGSGRAGVTYDVTPLGRRVVEQYADIRSALLIEAVKRVPKLTNRLAQSAHALELMTGIYEQAARTAATHRRRHPLPDRRVVGSDKAAK